MADNTSICPSPSAESDGIDQRHCMWCASPSHTTTQHDEAVPDDQRGPSVPYWLR